MGPCRTRRGIFFLASRGVFPLRLKHVHQMLVTSRHPSSGRQTAPSMRTSRQAVGSHAVGFSRWRCCAAHFGASVNSWLVGGVFDVTAEPPLSVNTSTASGPTHTSRVRPRSSVSSVFLRSVVDDLQPHKRHAAQAADEQVFPLGMAGKLAIIGRSLLLAVVGKLNGATYALRAGVQPRRLGSCRATWCLLRVSPASRRHIMT